MIGYLERSILYIMGSPVLMAACIMFVSMLYLVQKRAHRFRPQGTVRLFGTSAIMAVSIPLATTVIGWLIQTQLEGHTRELLTIISAPILVVFVFAVAVTLIQRFLGADAETALSLSWPIVVLTYVVPLAFCFILSIFQIGWLTGEEQLY
jgi:hypothetical protein